jgi:hypothetical protein
MILHYFFERQVKPAVGLSSLNLPACTASGPYTAYAGRAAAAVCSNPSGLGRHSFGDPAIRTDWLGIARPARHGPHLVTVLACRTLPHSCTGFATGGRGRGDCWKQLGATPRVQQAGRAGVSAGASRVQRQRTLVNQTWQQQDGPSPLHLSRPKPHHAERTTDQPLSAVPEMTEMLLLCWQGCLPASYGHPYVYLLGSFGAFDTAPQALKARVK